MNRPTTWDGLRVALPYLPPPAVAETIERRAHEAERPAPPHGADPLPAPHRDLR